MHRYRLFILAIIITLVALSLSAQAKTENTAGQDNYGYTFKDSFEPDGPAYSWEEISLSGISIHCFMGESGGYTCPVPIGFTFPFYENTYTELYFNIDGYISFGEGFGIAIDSSNNIPSLDLPNNEIAIFGGNLTYCTYPDSFYYQTLSNPTRFILEAKGVCAGYYWDPITFEAILYPNGDITVQYQSLLEKSSSFVGIENEVGADGLLYLKQLTDNLAIRYYYPTGARFLPANMNGYGRVGSTVTYQIELENKTGVETAFTLSTQPGNHWTTDLPLAQTPPVNENERIPLEIQVTIPPTATIGTTDGVVIQATAQMSPTITGTVAITTTATSDELGYVSVSSSWWGLPKTSVSYLAKVDPVTHSLVGIIDLEEVGCKPNYLAIPPDGQTIWAACPYSNKAVVIDRTSEKILKVISASKPTGIGFTQDEKYALVGNMDSNQVLVIDRQSYTLSSIPVSAPSDIIAVHPFLPRAYVTNRSGTLITIIDTETLSVVGTIDHGTISYWAAISNDGNRLYLSRTTPKDTVAVIDLTTNELIDTIIIGEFGGHVMDLATSIDDSKLFVNVITGAFEYSRIDVVDLSSKAINHIPISYTDSMHAMSLNCQGTELFSTNLGVMFDDTHKHLIILNAANDTIINKLNMPDVNQDGHFDPGAWDIALCPQLDARPKILPANQLRYVQPGETTVYTYTVKNISPSPISDTLTLEKSQGTWPVELSANTTGVLNWGESFTFTVTVNAPMDNAAGNQDDTTITIRSSNNPLNVRKTSLKTIYLLKTYLPFIGKQN